MTTVTVAHPVMAEASVRSVSTAVLRTLRAMQWLASVGRHGHRHAQELLQRRRDAQAVMEMARRFEHSQPGFASDLRMAAMRAIND